MITRDEVIFGFRLLLGRAPESEDAIFYHMRTPDIETFGRILRESEEFRAQFALSGLLNVSRQLWVKVDIPDGLGLWIDLHDDGVSAGCLRGSWEPVETDFVLGQLRPGDVFVDIGANIGWYTLRAAKAVGPTGRVYAFEPRAEIFARLERSVAENGLGKVCQLHKFALGSTTREGRLTWSSGERNPGHSYLANGDEVGTEGEIVAIRRLDECDLQGPVRLIKIDVEGAEPDVLSGALEVIKRDRPIIITEVLPRSLRLVSGYSSVDFISMLNELGYSCHRLNEYGVGRRIFNVPDDVSSPYVYFSVVMLPVEVRLQFLNSDSDRRVEDLEAELRRIRGNAQEGVK